MLAKLPKLSVGHQIDIFAFKPWYDEVLEVSVKLFGECFQEEAASLTCW